MSNQSSASGWPCNDWLQDLDAKLQMAGEGYQRCSPHDNDGDEHPNHAGIRANRTAFAMLAVGTIMDKLAELPGMQKHPGLAPLHDLTAALWELGRGGQPELLRPMPGVGKGRESISERWVREYALLFVFMLEETGMKGRPACRLVAKLLAEQGHIGRKRHEGTKPLSEGTIVDWRNRSRQHDFGQRDPEVASFLDRNRVRFRKMENWPYTEAKAIELITKMTQSHLIRSKSG